MGFNPIHVRNVIKAVRRALAHAVWIGVTRALVCAPHGRDAASGVCAARS